MALETQGNAPATPDNSSASPAKAAIQGAEKASPGISPINSIAKYELAKQALGEEGARIYINHDLERTKLQQKEALALQAEERAYKAPAIKSFYEDLEGQRQKIDEQDFAAKSVVNAINTGQTGTFSSANLGSFLENLGAPPEIRKALETPGSKEFKAASKTFLANTMRDTFKGTTTGREISIGEQIGAELGVNENANLAAAFFQQAKINIAKEKIRLVDELTAEGVAPSKIPAVVDKMIKPFVEEEKKEYFEAVRELGFR
jgi:hypothetical protein